MVTQAAGIIQALIVADTALNLVLRLKRVITEVAKAGGMTDEELDLALAKSFKKQSELLKELGIELKE